MRRRIYFLLLLLAGPLSVSGEKYNIEGDTIHVAPNKGVSITFPGDIRNIPPLCPDYKPITNGNQVTITMAKSVGSEHVSPCTIIINEGSRKSPRQHSFILVCVRELAPSDQLHDYSTKKKLSQHIDDLQNARKNFPVQVSGPSIAKPNYPTIPSSPVKDRISRLPRKPDLGSSLAEAKPKSGQGRNKKSPVVGPPTPDAAIGAGHSGVEGISPEEINKRVEDVISFFYKTCTRLGNKQDIKGAIDHGMELFNYNEEAHVETVSPKGETKSKKIRQYYNYLSQLPYRQVKIISSDIQYISDIHLGADGKWYGSAQIIQDFKAYNGDNIISFIDKTKKTFDFVIKTYDEEKGGRTVKIFEVFLNNISVNSVE